MPQLCPKRVKSGPIRLSPGPHHKIARRKLGLKVSPPDFLQLTPQTITGHRIGLELGNDQSDPRVTRCVVQPDHVEVLSPLPAFFGEKATAVRRPNQQGSSAERAT